jgi:hypothetical protein
MFEMRLKFRVRPTLITKNSKWERDNTLCLSFEDRPTKEALDKIIKFLSSQDTSGLKPTITYHND